MTWNVCQVRNKSMFSKKNRGKNIVDKLSKSRGN